jgi:hypothetical protein
VANAAENLLVARVARAAKAMQRETGARRKRSTGETNQKALVAEARLKAIGAASRWRFAGRA